MHRVKRLGLLVVAVLALCTSVASAETEFTYPAGNRYQGVTAYFKATSTNAQIDGTVSISCSHSAFQGYVKWAGGAISPAYIELESLTFTSCSRSVTVTAKGTIDIYSNGEVRSNGARITVQTTILGFPVHCIYKTENTKVGTLTEGVAPAVWHIGSSPLPQEATSGACGNDAVLTGTYTVTTPAGAIILD